MNLTKLTAAQFKKIAGLLEKKEALQARISEIDQKLTALGGDDETPDAAASPAATTTPAGASGRGKYRRSAAVRAKMAAAQKARWAKPAGAATVVSAPASGRKASKPAKGKRGAVKEAIIDVIKGAGKTGVTVKEVAQTLGIKYANASVWFGSTGKKVKEIKRLSRGTYAWVA